VLVTILALSYFSRTTTDRQLAQSSYNDTSADLLARSGLDIIVFVAHLDKLQAVAPVPPESVDVRWFSQANCTAADADIWDAAAHVDYELVFEMLRARRGDVFQWNDDYRRVVFGDGQIQYAWRRDDVSRS